MSERNRRVLAVWAFGRMDLSYDGGREDWGNLGYLRDTAMQAGWSAVALAIDQIGHAGIDFVDQDGAPIERLFKLYRESGWREACDLGRKLIFRLRMGKVALG
jgi:glutathionylspermidine synthase